MEINLKKRLHPNHTLPVMRDAEKAHKKITGMTSGNFASVPLQSVTYERSKEYLAHIAEIEIQRSLALAEAHRLSLR
jgi:hypothetical protein